MRFGFVVVLAWLGFTPANAHFGMIIPSDTMLTQEEGRQVTLSLSFSHPYEGDGMVLERPVSVTHTHAGETNSIADALSEATLMGKPGFTLEQRLARPGAHIFAMEPKPYWEPAEDTFIIHYTKTVISAYGDDEGWNTELGLPTEIVPLARPFGIWAGNLFQGVVKRDGAPVPFAEVEVEHFAGGSLAMPNDLMLTQTIIADANGIFSYVPPAAGWWGFAALSEADFMMENDGVEKSVELGAVIWVNFEEWAFSSSPLWRKAALWWRASSPPASCQRKVR